MKSLDSIGDHLHVKLTDMALSRDFFPNDYHCLGDNENRPIKWMAIESINRREFSNASDVVSRHSQPFWPHSFHLQVISL